MLEVYGLSTFIALLGTVLLVCSLSPKEAIMQEKVCLCALQLARAGGV